MKLNYETLREQRRKRKLTVEAFAQSIGFSRSYVSQIERGIINPSISALQKIAGALEIPIASLFGQELTPPVTDSGYCEVVRADDRKSFRYPHSSINYELLSPTFQCKIELIHSFARAGQSTPVYSHVGEEVVLVLRGTIEYWVRERQWILKKGDCIYHESHLPHHWRVVGDEEVELVSAVVPPSF